MSLTKAANLSVKNWQGEETGEATLEMKVAKPENAQHIVHRALVCQRTNQRQGTASTKTRAEVRGGGRKPWRQKGTGRARAGSIRSPLWRGGGVIFGPKPKDYNLKINKKERRLALRTAFMSRAEDLIVVDGIASNLEKPKTKEIVSALSRWGIEKDSKVLLIVMDTTEKNLYLSVRNVPTIKMIKYDCLNIYDILNVNKIVVTSQALELLQNTYYPEIPILINKYYPEKLNQGNTETTQDFIMNLDNIGLEVKFPNEVETGEIYDLEVILSNLLVHETHNNSFAVSVSSLDFRLEGSSLNTFQLDKQTHRSCFKLQPLLAGEEMAIKIDFFLGSRYLGQKRHYVNVSGKNLIDNNIKERIKNFSFHLPSL